MKIFSVFFLIILFFFSNSTQTNLKNEKVELNEQKNNFLKSQILNEKNDPSTENNTLTKTEAQNEATILGKNYYLEVFGSFLEIIGERYQYHMYD